MLHFELAGTVDYWQPAEQAERERTARMAALVTEARRSDRSQADQPIKGRGFIPRVAGVLGLV